MGRTAHWDGHGSPEGARADLLANFHTFSGTHLDEIQAIRLPDSNSHSAALSRDAAPTLRLEVVQTQSVKSTWCRVRPSRARTTSSRYREPSTARGTEERSSSTRTTTSVRRSRS